MSSNQVTESLVWLTLVLSHFRFISQQSRALLAAKNAGGEIKRTPTTLVGKLVTPVHALASILQVLLYIAAVALLGFRQPRWMEGWALPDGGLGEGEKRFVRIGASLFLWTIAEGGIRIVKQLGQSFHAIGVREKPKIVSTGAYGLVRHPLYTVALLMQLAYAPITWSYFPLIGFVVTALVFAVKMPIEEQLIESDESVGNEYREYKKKVRCRIIPYVW